MIFDSGSDASATKAGGRPKLFIGRVLASAQKGGGFSAGRRRSSGIPSFWASVSNKRIKKVGNISEKNQKRPIAGKKSTLGRI